VPLAEAVTVVVVVPHPHLTVPQAVGYAHIAHSRTRLEAVIVKSVVCLLVET
jgi:hypothetical protein